MYSPQFHEQQAAAYYYGSMPYQHMGEARRMSYTDYLSGQSEGSASDYEQSTPSPLNVYEDYTKEKYHPYQQQNFSYFPPLYQAEPMVLPHHHHQNAFYYPTPILDMMFPTTQFTGSLPMKNENAATPALEKDEQDSFHSSRSSSPEVPLKTACMKKSTKPRSKRASVISESLDIKTFKCEYDQCDRIFKRSEHLKRHIRSIHTKEKPYKCPYGTCGKQFARSDNLSQHIRIHRPNKEKTTRTRKSQNL